MKKLTKIMIIQALLLLGCTAKSDGTNLDYFSYKIDKQNNVAMITGYSGMDENVTVPSQIEKKVVTILGEGSFQDNEVIKSVILQEGITDIEAQAFYNSTLETIELPDTLKTIGDKAFKNTSLQEISIPDTVEKISKDAFDGIDEDNFIIHLTSNNTYCLDYVKTNNLSYELDGTLYRKKDEITLGIMELKSYMDNNQYDEIMYFFENRPVNYTQAVYYMQNDELVNTLTAGEATILLSNGIYVGEVDSTGQRNGHGKQLGIYTDNFSYTVADGIWKDDKLNGNATYYEPNITVLSSKNEYHVNFTYQGNFTNNYYDGLIQATWTSQSGTYYGTFNADMGNIKLLREEDGKYVYLDDGNGYYWYMTIPEGLINWKIWDPSLSTK